MADTTRFPDGGLYIVQRGSPVLPATGVVDALLFDATTKEIKYWNGAAWVAISAATPPASTRSSVLTWGNMSLTASTTTRFLTPGYDDAMAPALDTYRWRAPRAGTIGPMFVQHNTPGGNGNPVVYTVLIGGVPTALTVSLASTGTSGSSLATVAVAQNDLVSIQATKAAGIGGSGSLRPIVSCSWVGT